MSSLCSRRRVILLLVFSTLSSTSTTIGSMTISTVLEVVATRCPVAFTTSSVVSETSVSLASRAAAKDVPNPKEYGKQQQKRDGENMLIHTHTLLDKTSHVKRKHYKKASYDYMYLYLPMLKGKPSNKGL